MLKDKNRWITLSCNARIRAVPRPLDCASGRTPRSCVCQDCHWCPAPYASSVNETYLTRNYRSWVSDQTSYQKENYIFFPPFCSFRAQAGKKFRPRRIVMATILFYSKTRVCRDRGKTHSKSFFGPNERAIPSRSSPAAYTSPFFNDRKMSAVDHAIASLESSDDHSPMTARVKGSVACSAIRMQQKKTR